MSKRLPQISVLDELASTVSAVLRERGLGAVLADSCAREVAQDFARSVGGRVWFIPANIPACTKRQRAQRNAEIRASFTGDNAHQLARRFKLSKRRINQILAKDSNVVALRRAG